MNKKICLSLLFTICLPLFCLGNIPASERTALIAIYNATNGDNWTYKDEWKTEPLHTDGFAMPGTEENWYGVIVDSDHVIGLFLSGNGLKGPFPKETGDLTHLQDLSFNYNTLSGTIPSQIGNLTQLTRLQLMGNKLSGTIPTPLGNLKKLTVLMLAQNQFSGSIPTFIGSLSNLEGLYLNLNQFNGTIPSEIGNLRKLKSLDLSSNALSGVIPPQFGNLSQLVILKIAKTHLSGSIPTELCRCTNLEILYLNNNHLTGKLPAQMGNLIEMYYLLLNNNDFYGEIPTVFMGMKGLAALDIGNNCLKATDATLRKWLVLRDPDWESSQRVCGIPTIRINRSQFNFGGKINGITTTPLTALIENSGSGDLNWKATSSSPWLLVSPGSGVNTGSISISVDMTDLTVGSYTGTIAITDATATNSPQNITANFEIYGTSQGTSNLPFGEFATPEEGDTINNSAPVTGWVLDDIGIASVKIYNGDAYVGDAVFVEGARPDVETAYPAFPNNYKSGWGYMLLTRFLPNGGNGTYTIVAKATDVEGNQIVLGSKVVNVDNEHATDPFGAIDTPAQGGTASGSSYINWGWALTPQPASIPTDGSTIKVFIDGVNIGHPTYNIYREDIATFFPGFVNSNGAVGYFYLDTTQFTNGIHTISWNVTDSTGKTGGVGSRFFSIINTESATNSFSSATGKKGSDLSKFKPDLDNFYLNHAFSIDPIPVDSLPIKVIYGFESEREGNCTVEIGEEGFYSIQMRELGRIEINLLDDNRDNILKRNDIRFSGFMKVGEQLRGLPIGSHLDCHKGIFSWQVGPGFLGRYDLIFLETNSLGDITRKHIVVQIQPGNW